jgi:hypothetical protein
MDRKRGLLLLPAANCQPYVVLGLCGYAKPTFIRFSMPLQLQDSEPTSMIQYVQRAHKPRISKSPRSSHWVLGWLRGTEGFGWLKWLRIESKFPAAPASSAYQGCFLAGKLLLELADVWEDADAVSEHPSWISLPSLLNRKTPVPLLPRITRMD